MPPTVDLIAGAFVVAALLWGLRAGLPRSLTGAGFMVGAIAGATLAPRLLTDDQHSASALVFALPAALILGALVATLTERKAVPLAREWRAPGVLSRLAGAIVAACSALGAVWLLAAVFAQSDAVRKSIDESDIVASLDDVLERPGPGTAPAVRGFTSFPTVSGPRLSLASVPRSVVRDPQIQAADGSVVKIAVTGKCGGRGSGSGWIAADGIVATNAHVAAATASMNVRIQGRGSGHRATAIWFEPKNDIALLRVPGLRGKRALKLVRDPKATTIGAALGFPGGSHRILPARIGDTTAKYRGRIDYSGLSKEFPENLFGRLVTTFLAPGAAPGSSGGPIVDRQGRVLATIFGGGAVSAVAVPNRFVRSALRRAKRPVSTGGCRGGTSRFRAE